MKWILLASILLFALLTPKINAQNKSVTSSNGGVFTPKGTIRALIVYVSYKDQNSANPAFNNKDLHDWKYNVEHLFPDYVDPSNGDCPSFIFNKEADFEDPSLRSFENFSTLFHQMSLGAFKFIGEVIKDTDGKPLEVFLDPGKGYSWMEMNRLAVEAINKKIPDADLSRFDLRTNQPMYKFDNSDTELHQPDGILDFVVFIHRYSKNWKEQPKNSMRSWMGSGGGFAATGIPPNQKINGFSIADGFTMTYRSGVFVHEIAHVLFNAPHIMGVNNVIGDYFYLQNAGWGVMAPISLFSGFNAWERWYAGFIDLVADIKVEDDLSINNRFLLRDYITSGDAIRIEIPFSGGQYLWLENHQKIHPMDQHPWKGKTISKGETIGDSDCGIYAFVENIESSRSRIFSAVSNKANGIKVLHAGGNYDYELVENEKVLNNAWGNELYSFRRLDANPIAGLNNLFRFPLDKDGDGSIYMDKNYNSSKSEQGLSIYREEIEADSFVNLYGGFGTWNAAYETYGRSAAFKDGDYLDMNSNPMPLNYPKYNYTSKRLNPFYLNGLALKFEKVKGTQDYLVEIRQQMNKLCESTRWTGHIILPDITKDDKADLIIKPCVKLRLDRSGTVNTHEKRQDGTFVLPTQFEISEGAFLLMEKRSTIIVESDSELKFHQGARLKMDKKATLIIKKGANLDLGSLQPEMHPSAKIIYN